MLRSVASGPFPSRDRYGRGWRDAGPRRPFHFDGDHGDGLHRGCSPVARSCSTGRSACGILYGLLTYFVMNWIVVPFRFDAPLPPKPLPIATQLFAHLVLVGILFALIAARHLKRRAFA